MAVKKDAGSMTRVMVDAFAGALAGGVSRTITSPLDVIKIRFQVQLEPTSKLSVSTASHVYPSKYTGILQATKDIIKEEGLLGLWRGNVPALLMVMPYCAIQFMVLQKLKSVAAGSSRGEDHINLSPAISFLSGALAGCAATIGTYPFDVLRTVLASQGEPKIYPNLRSAFVGSLQSRGIRGIYAGLTPTLIQIIPYAGIQFGSYDMFKRWAMAFNRGGGAAEGFAHEPLSQLQLFTCGLAAGSAGKICCHPLDVVKKRFQVEGLKRHPRYGAHVEPSVHKNVWHTTRRILQKEGLAGLYKGLFPSLVKAAPASAITFVVYELASKHLRTFLT